MMIIWSLSGLVVLWHTVSLACHEKSRFVKEIGMAKSTHAFVVVIIGHFMHSLSLLIVLTRNRHCHKYVNISIDDFEMLIILTTLSLIHLCFTPVDTGLYPKWNQVLGLRTRHDVFLKWARLSTHVWQECRTSHLWNRMALFFQIRCCKIFFRLKVSHTVSNISL